jgi:hypothetical protein
MGREQNWRRKHVLLYHTEELIKERYNFKNLMLVICCMYQQKIVNISKKS